jgi:hypothetical protein
MKLECYVNANRAGKQSRDWKLCKRMERMVTVTQ